MVIAMIGAPFSPRYAHARELRGGAEPHDYCAVNVALRGPGRRVWALTERGRTVTRRSRDDVQIGASHARWNGSTLVVQIDERTAPFGRRLTGLVRVHAETLDDHWTALEGSGAHRWCAIAPRARIDVALDAPRVMWRGSGYIDANEGDEPLEQAFASWTWWRGGGEVGYRAVSRRGEVFDAAKHGEELAPLARTRWGLPRDAPRGARMIQTLEDGPFYARSLLEVGGAITMHESLSLDRFRTPWVRALLPFRMRRERA